MSAAMVTPFLFAPWESLQLNAIWIVRDGPFFVLRFVLAALARSRNIVTGRHLSSNLPLPCIRCTTATGESDGLCGLASGSRLDL